MGHLGCRISWEFEQQIKKYMEKTGRTKTEIITTAVFREITGGMPLVDDSWRAIAASIFEIRITQVHYALSFKTVVETFMFMCNCSKTITMEVIPTPEKYVIQFAKENDIYIVAEHKTLPNYEVIKNLVLKLEQALMEDFDEL